MKQEQYMRFPWGQHKGVFLKDVPTAYLKWCILNYTSEQGLQQVIKDELLRREPQLQRK
jgi:uncharacterized protein (DUF3820 family)